MFNLFQSIVLLSIFLHAQTLQTRTQVHMGTFAHIALPAQHNTLTSQSFQLIKKIEYSLSSYKPDALVYQLNRTHQVPYDSYLAEVLKLSKIYHQDTYGYFDVTIGSITKKLYRFGEQNNSIPAKKALKEAKLGTKTIDINTTSIATPTHITIDLGGIGKGYAIDKVARFLKKHNVTKGIVALSGDIHCLDICTFQLQSPYGKETFALLKSKIPNLSISTSGTYRRYIRTQQNHHLINPKTALQGKAFLSVSLFTHSNNAKIDAYATAISVMPKQTALAFLKKHDDIGYILLTSSQELIYGNLDKFVDLLEIKTPQRNSNHHKQNNKP